MGPNIGPNITPDRTVISVAGKKKSARNMYKNIYAIGPYHVAFTNI
jgi:hypothetical protein